MQFLDGGPALPTFTPPRPFERGVGGAPTLVQNVETLAHVALIARFGPEWFRGVGTGDERGSALVTVSGAVRRPGVYEIAVGTPLRDLVAPAGGTTAELGAVLAGGYFGAWLPAAEALAAPLSEAGLAPLGGALGARAFVALPATSCGVAETARVVRYLAGESAGQCGPCVHGLAAIANDLVQSRAATTGRDRAARSTPATAARRAWRLPPSRRRRASRRERAARLRRGGRAPRARPLQLPRRASVLPLPHAGRRRCVSDVLRVNPIACDAHGLCAELLPERIRSTSGAIRSWRRRRSPPGWPSTRSARWRRARPSRSCSPAERRRPGLGERDPQTKRLPAGEPEGAGLSARGMRSAWGRPEEVR